uniref:Retrotransposon gag domain-containing protein n=1 Tax=Cannabis sativa TaxID=3483 RepID=A0A803PI94_CANSA
MTYDVYKMGLCLFVEDVLYAREENLNVWTDMLRMYWAFESIMELVDDYDVKLEQHFPRMPNWKSRANVEIHKDQLFPMFSKKTCDPAEHYFEGNNHYNAPNEHSHKRSYQDDSKFILETSPVLPSRPCGQETTTRPKSIGVHDQIGRQETSLPIPQKFKNPSEHQYTGKEDSLSDIHYFEVQTYLLGVSNDVRYRIFPGTLTGLAQQWYLKLSTRSIDSCKDLVAAFGSQFTRSGQCQMKPNDLVDVK